MGIGPSGIEFLLYANGAGASFRSTAMIGRQYPLTDERHLALSLRKFGRDVGPDAVRDLLRTGFAEPILKLLGADHIDSFDVDAFEGATVIHNFNYPISESLHGKYSVVMEQGTLEHVFNYPCALQNCMEMVEVGGHLILYTPANNWLGHGFYQFCPELFFQSFNKQNGFEIVRMMVCRDYKRSIWYEIRSPEDVNHASIGVTAPFNLTLHVLAKRTCRRPIFEVFPQQVHYELDSPVYKSSRAPDKAVATGTLRQWLVNNRERLPLSLLDLLRGRRAQLSFANSTFRRVPWPS